MKMTTTSMFKNVLDILEFFERHPDVKRLDGKYNLGNKWYNSSACRVKDIIRIDIKEL